MTTSRSTTGRHGQSVAKAGDSLAFVTRFASTARHDAGGTTANISGSLAGGHFAAIAASALCVLSALQVPLAEELMLPIRANAPDSGQAPEHHHGTMAHITAIENLDLRLDMVDSASKFGRSRDAKAAFGFIGRRHAPGLVTSF